MESCLINTASISEMPVSKGIAGPFHRQITAVVWMKLHFNGNCFAISVVYSRCMSIKLTIPPLDFHPILTILAVVYIAVSDLLTHSDSAVEIVGIGFFLYTALTEEA